MSQKIPMPYVVYILALTNFALTTAEFMVAGMMPSLALALNVTIGEIGYLISWYALGMAIGGPVLTMVLLAFRVSSKLTLLWLLGTYVIGAVLAAIASSYDMMAFGRIIMGVASSACFGVSMSICAGLVSSESRGRAVSLVLAGLMLAPVFGVPSTALIEQSFGWRASFWSVTVLAILCTAIVAWKVPAIKEKNTVRLMNEVSSLRNAELWAAYLTSALIIGATFAAFSYFSPIFIEVTGFAAERIPMLLMVYGVANVCGNIIVGRLADKHTIKVLFGGLSILTIALGLFASFAHQNIISLIAFIAIGLTGVALNPAMAIRVMRVASQGPLVNTMHISMITAGLAFGSWIGGVAINEGYGLRSPLWIGAILAGLGLVSLIPYLQANKKVPDLSKKTTLSI